MCEEQIENLLALRKENISAKVITKLFRNNYDKHHTSRKKNSLEGNNIINMLGRMMQSKNMNGNELVISNEVKSKAKESYETMIENSKLGEICVVEKCFVFTGTTEQSLMLCALKQVGIAI